MIEQNESEAMREQFEKLPEIARLIREYNAVYVQWRYDCSNSVITGYLNGAYYAFQEQQKRIETIFQKMDDMGMVDTVQILEDYIDYRND